MSNFPKKEELRSKPVTKVFYKDKFMYTVNSNEEFLTLQLWALKTQETHNIKFEHTNESGENLEIFMNTNAELTMWPMLNEMKLMRELVTLKRNLKNEHNQRS